MVCGADNRLGRKLPEWLRTEAAQRRREVATASRDARSINQAITDHLSRNG
jgi:hypothetical protein